MCNVRMAVANRINEGIPLALRAKAWVAAGLRKNAHDLFVNLCLGELLLHGDDSRGADLTGG